MSHYFVQSALCSSCAVCVAAMCASGIVTPCDVLFFFVAIFISFNSKNSFKPQMISENMPSLSKMSKVQHRSRKNTEQA